MTNGGSLTFKTITQIPPPLPLWLKMMPPVIYLRTYDISKGLYFDHIDLGKHVYRTTIVIPTVLPDIEVKRSCPNETYREKLPLPLLVACAKA